eukprot:COSAG01_NODE_2309_length_7942_cov_7.425602_11_plen_74_part_00
MVPNSTLLLQTAEPSRLVPMVTAQMLPEDPIYVERAVVDSAAQVGETAHASPESAAVLARGCVGGVFVLVSLN